MSRSETQSAQSTPPVEQSEGTDVAKIVSAYEQWCAGADPEDCMILVSAALLTPPPVTASVERVLSALKRAEDEGLSGDTGLWALDEYPEALTLNCLRAALKEGHSLSTVIREAE